MDWQSRRVAVFCQTLKSSGLAEVEVVIKHSRCCQKGQKGSGPRAGGSRFPVRVERCGTVTALSRFDGKGVSADRTSFERHSRWIAVVRWIARERTYILEDG